MARSACIEKISCPDCEQPNTHLQVYINEDKALGITWYTSFCHADCWEAKGDPYVKTNSAPKKRIKTDAEVKAEVSIVRSCKNFHPKSSYRGIPPEFYKGWGCKLLLSEYDGVTPYAIGFPYTDYGKLCGYKARAFKKNQRGKKVMFAVGRTANVDMFGLERAFKIGGDTLWVTEGEFDAIALNYCLFLATGEERNPVISLTAGGGSITKNLDYVYTRMRESSFKKFVFVLDDDKVGKQAGKDAKELWGSKVRIAKKPSGCKDANDAVKDGKGKEQGYLALGRKYDRNREAL